MIKAEFVKGVVGSDPILSDGVPQVAFVGRSNVGKSSLINVLLERRTLARTGAKPGKTLEINFYKVNDAAYLVDLPGYGFAKGSLSSREKIRKLILWYLTSGEARPQMVVLVIDIKAGLTKLDEEMLSVLRAENHPHIIIANKSDLLNQKETAKQIAHIKEIAGDCRIFLHSSQYKKGTDALREYLFAHTSALSV